MAVIGVALPSLIAIAGFVYVRRITERMDTGVLIYSPLEGESQKPSLRRWLMRWGVKVDRREVVEKDPFLESRGDTPFDW